MNTNGSDLPLDAVKLHRERRRATSENPLKLDFSDLGAKGVGYELVTSPPKER